MGQLANPVEVTDQDMMTYLWAAMPGHWRTQLAGSYSQQLQIKSDDSELVKMTKFKGLTEALSALQGYDNPTGSDAGGKKKSSGSVGAIASSGPKKKKNSSPPLIPSQTLCLPFARDGKCANQGCGRQHVDAPTFIKGPDFSRQNKQWQERIKALAAAQQKAQASSQPATCVTSSNVSTALTAAQPSLNNVVGAHVLLPALLQASQTNPAAARALEAAVVAALVGPQSTTVVAETIDLDK